MQRIVESSVNDIRLIGEFAQEIHQNLAEKLRPIPETQSFTAAEIAQLNSIGEAVLSTATKAKRRITRKPEKVFELDVSDRVAALMLKFAIPVKQQSFMAEMSLVYVISRLEAFLKDYAREMLLARPEMLRSSNQMSCEEVLSYRSMAAVREALANREADGLGRGSIDDIAVYFEKKANISLSNFDAWEAIREHVYRRNLVVHNRGFVNELYRKKTKSTSANGQHLSTTMDYVVAAVENIKGFIHYVHTISLRRLRLNEC
ncbi:hypothetical protein GJ700_27890 [Duganella sp. FT92W]|uniref:RiboL-PSP-HEPN domain-containing protein n=1 Tax=Pseudoduganella rivuli TaxID=2666085 RepID=A0A7X2IT84_9BURK|nr:hypothetical protein [Pseudoduganella rivuli]MRV75545.1 hypothetical protein [Pseudoduganella rivuli]